MRPDVAQALEDVRNQMTDLQTSSTGWLETVTKRRVVVHTRDGQSVEGSLSDVMADGVVLKAALLLTPGGPDGSRTDKTAMAGEVWIPQANVAFAQLDE